MKREEARRRAEELVSQMTLEERAGQLRYDAPAIERLGIPAYNWWSESLHGVARAGLRRKSGIMNTEGPNGMDGLYWRIGRNGMMLPLRDWSCRMYMVLSVVRIIILLLQRFVIN